MKIVNKLDAGPYINQIKIKINKDTNSGKLKEKLSILGAKALEESINLILSKKEKYHNQKDKDATYAKKLKNQKQKLIGRKMLKKLF